MFQCLVVCIWILHNKLKQMKSLCDHELTPVEQCICKSHQLMWDLCLNSTGTINPLANSLLARARNCFQTLELGYLYYSAVGGKKSLWLYLSCVAKINLRSSHGPRTTPKKWVWMQPSCLGRWGSSTARSWPQWNGMILRTIFNTGTDLAIVFLADFFWGIWKSSEHLTPKHTILKARFTQGWVWRRLC